MPSALRHASVPDGADLPAIRCAIMMPTGTSGPDPGVADLIDVGANLTHESFSDDLPAVMDRAASAGVHRLLVTGTWPDEAVVYRELCLIVEEWLDLMHRDGRPLPPATTGRNLAGMIA